MERSLSSYTLVTRAADLEVVAGRLAESEVVGVDTETTGLSPRDGRIRLLQLATGDETYIVDLFEVGDLSPLREVLEDGPEKIAHNAKFDFSFLRNEYGVSLSPLFDTMLAAQLLSGGDQTPSFSLEAVAQRYVEVELDKEARKEDWSGELSEAQLEYAARDAAVLLPLRERLAGELEADGLGYVAGIEFRAVAALAEMELAGIKLDLARWKELERTVRERRDEAASRLESFFPRPEGVLPLEGLGPRLNLNSPKQITDAFKSLGIDLVDTKVWTLLKVDHPAAKALLEYRELQKKLGTYLETYANFVHPKTGRIHANFLQCRVPTGRLACVARGTLVEVARDQSKNFAGVPVESVRAGDLAYTYDENRRLTLRRVLWAGKTGRREVLSVRWRSGSHKREGVLEVTPDHEVRLSSGEYVRAENLKPGDRVLALGRDTGGWGYSRIYATGYPGPIREHRFVFEAVNGRLPEHVHHTDENKLNNVPENLVGMTNSKHVRYHVNGRMDEAERSRLARIARDGWTRNRGERLISSKRGEESGRWLGLDNELMEEVLWENAGKPTAFRDVYGIDWKAIAENFTRRGELIDHAFHEETRKRMRELGFDAGLKASGISSRRWKKIKARFETFGVVPNNHEILAVERTGRFVDVYDLEVEDTHNFIAGEICVHNCTNPNVQQIPHEDEFRRCFVAERGNVLIIADYSQVELRILAEVSGDPAFVEAFQRGDDLHRVTAATMYGVPIEAVSKEQRSDAKRINFGLMYGRGARSLSAQLGASEERGRQLIDEYFANYPKVQRFLQRTANRAVRDRTLRTLAGRLRKFGNSPVADDRGAMRREAMNYPIQGCLRGNVRIFERSAGYVPIRSLVGRDVSVWDGERFSGAMVVASGKKRLARVVLKGGHGIECSPDHKFLVRNNNGGEAWKTAREIRVQERVVLVGGLRKWELDLSLPPAEPGRSWNANTADLNEIGTREELGEWLGRVASDGGVSERAVTLLVAEHEEVLLPKLLSLTRRLGHATHQTRVTEHQPRRLHRLTLSCTGLARQMKSMGIKERVPDVAWRSRSVLCGYLRGLFDGDGTAHPDGPVLTFGRGGKQLGWAREVQEVLLLLGIRSRIGVYGTRVNVRVMKKDVPLFCSDVGFMNPVKQEKAEAVSPSSYKGKASGSVAYGRAQKVESVEVTDEWVEMYDVVDSETGRFAANGIVVHNSSADIAKLALVYVREELEGLDADLINCVHDEFVVECAEEAAPEVAERTKAAMLRAGEEILEKVPVEVEVVTSPEWRK